MGAGTVRLVMFRVVVPALAGVLIALGLEQAFAAIWTDKLDYSPGEVVTISGDNSNGAGYLPGETVRVEVWGPNGYYATCEATVDGNGAWSCQVTLWPDERAIGEYTYTARGLTSGVQESGTFWDGGDLDYAPNNITFNNVSPGTTLTFTQIVTAPARNDAFTATLKVTGLPSGWSVSASPPVLTFTAGPNAQSWAITIQVPAGTGSGSYSFNVKADPQKISGQQRTPGEGNGTQVIVNVSAPTPTPTPTPTPVPNQAPAVTAPDNQTANEGEAKTFNLGSFSDDSPGPWQITVNWDDGNIESFSVSATGPIPSRTHTYADNGNYTVTVTVTDKNGASGSASFQVTVNNVAPVATFSAGSPIDEGSSSMLSFANPFDPSPTDTSAGFRYAFACDGDINALPTAYNAAGSSTTALCFFPDNGVFTVAGRIFDKDNGYTTYTATVQVNNVPPAIQVLSVTPSEINEGGSVTLTGTIFDPGIQDLITVTVSWGDGTSDLVTLGLGRAFTLTHQYLDDNPSGTPSDTYTITVTAVDDDGGSSDAASTSVTVNNVPPTVGPLTGAPADPIPVNTRITVTAVFTDPGILDTHTVTVYWDWDTYNPNVTTSPSSTLTLSTGTRSFTVSYVYSQAGVYTIRAVVADDDGGSGEVIYQYVVVYDPSAGFVTGGGWFWSPKGACQLSWCQDAEGRANFGFVSKYQKGAKVPTGQTEFQFQAGNLNFHSDAYQWLVISGPKAQYKGTGTLNGVSGYGFLLTAWDGQVSGGGGQDKFRIKIWDSYGNVVYDNQMGADDAADPTTVIQGSIVIHTK